MSTNLNNLVNKSKNIIPYTNKIITADNYLKTEKLIADDGCIIYGNSSNIVVYPTKNVSSGRTGPIIQLYGAGGLNANVGINFDTFQSPLSNKNGRNNNKNPATQILAIDNGNYSSDLVFYTSPESSDINNLPKSEERMKIQSDGNILINNNLNILQNLEVYGTTNYFDNNLYINGVLEVNGLLTFGSTGTFLNNVNINGNLGVTGTSTVGGKGTFLNNVDINGNLGVTGISTFGNNSIFKNDVIINGNLGVTGTSNFYNTVNVSNLNVTNTSSFTYLPISEQLPSSPYQLVNKQYTDTISSGLKPIGAVDAVAITEITLNGVQVIDGYTGSVGDRILVNGQGYTGQSGYTGNIANGIYIMETSTWPRSTDFDTGYESPGTFCYSLNGDTYGDNSFIEIARPGIVGTNLIYFTIFNNSKFVLGQGLEYINQNTIQVKNNIGFVNQIGTGVTGLIIGTTGYNNIINGNVGIGTINPSCLLDVNGISNFGGTGTFNNNLNISGNLSVQNIIIPPRMNYLYGTLSISSISLNTYTILQYNIANNYNITYSNGDFTFPPGVYRISLCINCDTVSSTSNTLYCYLCDTFNNVIQPGECYFPNLTGQSVFLYEYMIIVSSSTTYRLNAFMNTYAISVSASYWSRCMISQVSTV